MEAIRMLGLRQILRSRKTVVLKEPLVKKFSEGATLSSLEAEKLPFTPFTPEGVAYYTGLSRQDAVSFLRKTMFEEPYLYVLYDVEGRVISWGTEKDEGYARRKARADFLATPAARSYKIYKAGLDLERIKWKWRAFPL